MKLTIGMIVKNEEKWLDKCLSAIKPILENVDCELIITDTGSTDKTVEIAKRFTDNVLHFDWCDDFSAARNYGLEKARGEWFMYLDADDIFESCDEIIDFFNSGEYKKYNSASYIGRNICDANGRSQYNKQPRLTKIRPDTRFKYQVHEVFNTYGAPKKDLNDVAAHYGYLYESDEQRAAKVKRNRDLLLKRLEKERNTSAFVYVQLSQNEIDYDEALKYVEDGIKVAIKNNDVAIIPLMQHRVHVYVRAKRYKEAVKAANEYFAIDKKIRPGAIYTDVEVYALKAMALYCLDRHMEVVETYKKFFTAFELVKDGKLNTPDRDIVLINAASEDNYIGQFAQFLTSALIVNEYDIAYKYIRKSSFKGFVADDLSKAKLVEKELEILKYFDYSNIDTYLNGLDDDCCSTFLKKLGQMLVYSNKKEQIIAAFKSIPACAEKAKIYEAYFGGEDIAFETLLEYTRKNGVNEDPGIIMIAMDKQYDISAMLTSDKCDIKKLAQDGYMYYYGFHKAADNYDITALSTSDGLTAAAEFFENCMYCTVGFKSPKPKVFVSINANRLIERFGMIGLRAEESGVISCDRMKAASMIGRSVESRRKKAYKECIAELKNAVSVYKPIAKFIQDYCNDVIAEYEAESKARSQDGEMQRLAAAIKNNIRGYIATGNIVLAQKTLSEYKSIAPADPDISILQKEISDKI